MIWASSSGCKPKAEIWEREKDQFVHYLNNFANILSFGPAKPDNYLEVRATVRFRWPTPMVSDPQPTFPNRPNEGSVKRSNEKKPMRQRREFILVRVLRKTV